MPRRRAAVEARSPSGGPMTYDTSVSALTGQVKPRPRGPVTKQNAREHARVLVHIWLWYHTSVLTTTVKNTFRRAQSRLRCTRYFICIRTAVRSGFVTSTSTIVIRVSFFNLLCTRIIYTGTLVHHTLVPGTCEAHTPNIATETKASEQLKKVCERSNVPARPSHILRDGRYLLS